MAQNDISPGFIRVFYARGSTDHTMTLPVVPINPVPGATGNEIEQNNGTAVSAATGLSAFITLLADLTIDTVTFNRAELWSKPLPSSNPIFVESFTLGIPGTSGANPPPYTQLVLTHRTNLGGLHRLYIFGSAFDQDVRDVAPFTSPAVAALSGYMTSGVSWIFGRDNGQLISPIAITTKINDAVRKRGLGL